MQSVPFARRAVQLSAVAPPSPPAGNIAFDSGHAFPGLLPDLTAEAQAALTRFRAETLQYAPRMGLPELRAWIAEYMRADGATVAQDNILVTNGAKHALELVCRILLDEGDGVVVTAPTYFSAIPILRSFAPAFIEVPQDADGLDVRALSALLERRARDGHAQPKFIYDVPDFHNPSGVTMSHDRRVALLELAARHRIVVIEDSPYRKVRFAGQSVPSLKALDRHDLVIHLGTFSKLMAPGMRVGWVAAQPEVVARMAQLKTDAGSCPLTQRMIVQFCTGTDGARRFSTHIDRVQAQYRANRNSMVTAVRRELPEVSFDVPEGGYYLWLSLPDDLSGDELAARAGNAGVTVIAGSRFYATADTAHPRNRVRVAYSHATPEEIHEGVRRLASAFAAMAGGRAAALAR